MASDGSSRGKGAHGGGAHGGGSHGRDLPHLPSEVNLDYLNQLVNSINLPVRPVVFPEEDPFVPAVTPFVPLGDGELVLTYPPGGSHVSFPANFAVISGARHFTLAGAGPVDATGHRTVYFPNGGTVYINKGNVFTTLPMTVDEGCTCYIPPGGYAHLFKELPGEIPPEVDAMVVGQSSLT